MPKKNILLFVLLVIISFVLMTFQSRKGHLPINNLLHNLLNNTHKATKSLSDSVTRPFERMALNEEDNIKLQKRIDDLLMEREKYQEALIENKRLKELLRLRESSSSYITSAKVIARGVDYWTNTLIIDKGLKDGVEKDMSAITPKGLAGKVISVSDSYSQLLLISDINFSVTVRVQETRKEGVISGTGTRKCVLKYIPYEEEIKTGDIVITSGLDSLFPPGIQVGYVSKVDNKGAGGHFQYIEVVPFQDDKKIEEVIIVR